MHGTVWAGRHLSVKKIPEMTCVSNPQREMNADNLKIGKYPSPHLIYGIHNNKMQTAGSKVESSGFQQCLKNLRFNQIFQNSSISGGRQAVRWCCTTPCLLSPSPEGLHSHSQPSTAAHLASGQTPGLFHFAMKKMGYLRNYIPWALGLENLSFQVC